MRKIVFYAPKDVRLEVVEGIPVCEEGGLLVKVEAASICGSDIKAYNVGNPRLKGTPTIGHEFVGRVVESKTDAFAVGARITMASTIGCGTCYYCKLGKFNLCPENKPMGYFFDGAMADYMAVPALAVRNGNVVPVNEAVPAIVAAMAEPISCVMNGLSRAPVAGMNCAVVIGLGALGLFHSLVLRDQGVKNIVCCDFPGVKFDIAKELGFTVVTPEELKAQYLDLSEGLGFELVVITAPANSVQAEAPMYARKGGHVSYFASLPVSQEMIEISSRKIHYGELVLYGTSDSTAEHVRKALVFMERCQEEIIKMITVLPMEDWLSGMQGVMDMRYAKVVLSF